MFKKYNDKFKPYNQKNVSDDFIKANRAAVFARIGTENLNVNQSYDINPACGESTEPDVLYPRKISLRKSLVPAVAAVLALAVAVPAGIHLLGGRAEVAVSVPAAVSAASAPSNAAAASASAAESSAAASASAAESSAAASASAAESSATASASAAESSAAAVLPAPPLENADSACVKAFKEYYREKYDYIRRQHPDDNMISDISFEKLAEYAKELDITKSANGLTVNIRGMIDAGRYLLIAFDFQTDKADGKLFIDVLLSSEFAGNDEIRQIRGNNIPDLTEKYGDMYVAVIDLYERYIGADKDDTMQLCFDYNKREEDDFAGSDILEKSVVIDVPNSLDNYLSLPYYLTNKYENTNVPPDTTIFLNSLCLTIETPAEYNLDEDILSLKVIMKDGSLCYASQCTKYSDRQLGKSAMYMILFAAPLDINEIMRIETESGRVFYKA